MSAPQPFFSVIMPVYNRAALLRRGIESVLAQTCQDFEIVIVDDGSSDDPQAAIAGFGDPRIRFLVQENGGGGKARNTAIDAARGRFIAPLDSDDVFLPGHLQTMREVLEGTTGMVGYARIVVDRGAGRTLLKPPRAIRPHEHMASYLFCDRGFVPTITIAVEREMAKRIRYSENLRPAEDSDFAIRLYLAGCRFVMVEQPGAVWSDIADPKRTSATRKHRAFGEWLKAMEPSIPRHAYLGARGWPYAKLIARQDRKKALRFYLTALCHGCYRPGLAIIIFLQIFLADRAYRSLADTAIGWLHAGLRDTPTGKRRLENT